MNCINAFGTNIVKLRIMKKLNEILDRVNLFDPSNIKLAKYSEKLTARIKKMYLIESDLSANPTKENSNKLNDIKEKIAKML